MNETGFSGRIVIEPEPDDDGKPGIAVHFYTVHASPRHIGGIVAALIMEHYKNLPHEMRLLATATTLARALEIISESELDAIKPRREDVQ